jgi:hypothetical protein
LKTKSRFFINRARHATVGPGVGALSQGSYIGPPGGNLPSGSPNFIFANSAFSIIAPPDLPGFANDYLIGVIHLSNEVDFVVNSETVTDDGGNIWTKIASNHYNDGSGVSTPFHDLSLWTCNVSNGLQTVVDIEFNTTPPISSEAGAFYDFSINPGIGPLFVVQNSIINQMFTDAGTPIPVTIDLNNFAFLYLVQPNSAVFPAEGFSVDEWLVSRGTDYNARIQEITTAGIQDVVATAFPGATQGAIGVVIACAAP